MLFTIGFLVIMYALAFSGASVATDESLITWFPALFLIPGGVLIGIGLVDTGLVKSEPEEVEVNSC